MRVIDRERVARGVELVKSMDAERKRLVESIRADSARVRQLEGQIERVTAEVHCAVWHAPGCVCLADSGLVPPIFPVGG